jgi:SagB-type dehydrogenase family enzyme
MNDKKLLAELFHENTKVHNEFPQIIKDYPFTPERKKVYSQKDYTLSADPLDSKLEDVLIKRKSSKLFEVRTPISIRSISKLLRYSYGLHRHDGQIFRTVPSAGARYPIYLYLFAFNISGMDKGIYFYDLYGNSLSKIKNGDYRERLKECIDGVNRMDVERCSFAIITTADINHTCEKYGNRGYRYIMLDAGHISQNFYLVSEDQKIACKAVGGFKDNKLMDLLGLDKTKEIIVLTHFFGKEQFSISEYLQLNLSQLFN